MGGFCCCFCNCNEDFEEHVHPSNPIYRQCICLRHIFHNIFGGYAATFHRLDSRPSNLAQGAASLGSSNPSAGTTDSFLAETFQLVSRPLPFDTDPRYTCVQREGLVSRREKSINLTQEESLALRRNGSSSAIEHIASQKKRSSTDTDSEYKVHRSESTNSLSAKAYNSSYTLVTSEDEDVCPTCLEASQKKRSSTDTDSKYKVHRSESTKSLSAKAYNSSYTPVTSEDEDVCPTCLEEYTPDNPKIITKCCHHFHLGCIYEWMERSDTCPICGKEMEFCESP